MENSLVVPNVPIPQVERVDPNANLDNFTGVCLCYGWGLATISAEFSGFPIVRM